MVNTTARAPQGSWLTTAATLATTALLTALPTFAQNRTHPGKVHIGANEWVTPAEAQARGMVLYRDRWLPKKLSRKLRKWERLDAKVKGWKDAYRTKSKHYRIQSNAPHYVMELEIKPFLDELYRTYLEVFREDFGLKGKAANKNFIKIYWGYEDYRQHEESDRTTSGYFDSDELIVYYDVTDPGEFYNTVFHEGAHQFFAATLPGASLPIWLDEALAVYFEGCTFSRATSKIERNHIPPSRLEDAQLLLHAAREEGRSMRAADLFMQFEGDDFDADHYALAWSFAHYLIWRDGGEQKSAFYKFLKEMNGSGTKPVDAVFRQATKSDLADVEKGWVEYVLNLKTEPSIEWVELKVTGAGQGEDVVTGDWIWSIDDVLICSEAQLEEAWEARPKDRPFELKVVKIHRVDELSDYETRFATISVKPGSKLQIEPDGAYARAPNLID